jgi:tetratricopeptide (TPR) repeat protein
MECLDQRLAELHALVGLLAAADEPLVLAATTAANKLSSLGDCADVPALLAPDPLPKQPAARTRVIALQAKLAEARATYKAARPKDALAIVTAITPDVLATNHLPTEATLHFLTGQALWVLQGPDKGEPELMKAVLAAESGKADETKVEAWLQLTNLATDGARFDVAAERLQHASAALDRLGTKSDLHIRVLASDALLSSRQGHYDKALATAKRARELADTLPDRSNQAYALLVEATILNAGGHAGEALDDFKKVLAYHEELGHRRIEVAATLGTMASAEMLLGRPDDAIAHLQRALDIDESIYGHDNIEVGRAISALAVARSAKGDLVGALALDKQSLDIIAHTQGETSDNYAMVLGQLAGTLVALGRHVEALPYLDRALAIQTAKLGPGHVQTLTIMQTKCDALHAAGQLTAAIAMCKRTLATAEASLGHDNALLFIFLGHTGDVLLDAHEPRDAIAMFERALALGTNDPSDIHYVTFEDGRAHWDAGDRRKGVELAHKARDGFASLGADKAEQTKDCDAWLGHHKL